MRWGWWWCAYNRAFFQSLLTQTYLVVLVALCVIGNAMFTLSSSYLISPLVGWFPASRMVHFLASAHRVIKNYQTRQSHRRRGRDGSGMTVANLLGIPLGTYLSQDLAGVTPFC